MEFDAAAILLGERGGQVDGLEFAVDEDREGQLRHMDDRQARLQQVAHIAVALEAQTGCPAPLMIAQWAQEPAAARGRSTANCNATPTQLKYLRGTAPCIAEVPKRRLRTDYRSIQRQPVLRYEGFRIHLA